MLNTFKKFWSFCGIAINTACPKSGFGQFSKSSSGIWSFSVSHLPGFGHSRYQVIFRDLAILGKSSSGIWPFSVSHLLGSGQSQQVIFRNCWVGKNAVADFLHSYLKRDDENIDESGENAAQRLACHHPTWPVKNPGCLTSKSPEFNGRHLLWFAMPMNSSQNLKNYKFLIGFKLSLFK